MSSIVIVELAGIFLRKSRRVSVGVKRSVRRLRAGTREELLRCSVRQLLLICSFIARGLCSAMAQSGEPKLDDSTAMQASKNSIR
jgi:hypothetical protein